MKNSNKIWTIISFEFLTRVKSKGFIISTILGPVFLLAIMIIPGIVASVSMNDTSKHIAVIDETNYIAPKLIEDDPKVFFTTTKNAEELKKELLKGELDAFLIIPKDIYEKGEVSVYTPGGGGIGLIEKIDKIVSDVVREKRLMDAGVNEKIIKIVESGVSVKTIKVTEQGTQKDYTEFFSIFGYILGFMIYFLMFMYGAIVMRGVITEKVNRIIEVINSSAKPMEIMMGKIFGIGAVGLLQVLIWVGLLVVISLAGGSIISMFTNQPQMANLPAGTNPQIKGLPFDIPTIPIGVWIAFIFFFLTGYFIYSALFAAVGSAVDQEEDAQQLQTPITLPLIIPILFMPAIMGNPDGVLAIVLSLFPFFSPIIMTARIAATSVPIWQIALSVVLTLTTLFLCIWFASKIYRVGILMYGKKPSFKDLIKWLKLAK
ncbi:MAG: ABC transporter permease [Candidatus Kapaibacteriota bacterium]